MPDAKHIAIGWDAQEPGVVEGFVNAGLTVEESIVMTEALELSHLDYEEFLAAYESITVALASHLRELGSYREAH